MTLADILAASDQNKVDLTQTIVFSNGAVVYDFKQKDNNIALISGEDFEAVTVYELVKYTEECELEYDTTYFVDENTGEFFMNHSWESENLLLSY